MMKGIVIQSTGSWYLVRTEQGTDMECRIRGKLRLEDRETTNPVVVGDEVTCKKEPDQNTGVITAIHDRKNYIIRSTPHLNNRYHVIAANLDQAMLLVTFAQPETSLGFIDRFLVTSAVYEVPVNLTFNKSDIYTGEQLKKQKEIADLYEKVGYDTMLISAQTGKNLDRVREFLKDKKTLVAGHSGVGKTTLINQLHPKLDLKTKQVSDYTGKGKHATSYTSMYEMPFGGWIIDTPGIKEFGLVDIEPQELGFYFPEMHDYLNACKFHNCVHHNEPKCAVKAAVEEGGIAESRYKNYLKILGEIEKQQAQRYS